MIIEDRAAVSYLSSDLFLTPRTVFGLIWTITVWEMLRDNINLYVFMQSSRDPYWYNITVLELKIFVAITIYMGVFHFSIIYDYWRVDGITSIALIVVEKMT